VAQILLNLTLNAAAAMEGSETRRVRFELSGGTRRRRATDGGSVAPDPDRVDSIVCRVVDSGPGVRLDDPERIFDPFFTTKDPGEGTGLGLANARRLAQEMGGDVELDLAESRLGGAAFRLILPIDVEDPSHAGSVRGAEAAAAQSRIP
jgi:signal transduction histidine kinase